MAFWRESKPRYAHLFIVTYGRSGSTLLQGILNSIPGYLIRGENGNVLNQMRYMLRNLDRVQQQYRSISKEDTDPWYGIDEVDRRQLIDDLRELFIRNYLRPAAGTRCLGFKEIRYGVDNVDDLAGHLDFVSDMFPRSCFIFNARNVTDTSLSGWWAQRADAFDYLSGFRDRMAEVYGRRLPNYFWVSYDEYVRNPSALAGLYAFLGEPFDLPTVTASMERLHSSQTAHQGRDTRG